MRQFFIGLLCVAALVGAGCSEFPTSYDRIEPDKPRLLDFIYEPADAAPGDTVLVKAIFAGRTVTPDDLTWEIAREIVINDYGVATATDTVPLEITPRDFTFSERTSTVAFSFVIPRDIIEKSPTIPENWTSIIPDYYQKAIPEALSSFSKTDLLQVVDFYSAIGSTSPSDITDEQQALKPLLPVLLQCFTAPIQIFCTLRGAHTIVSDYSVRYNSRFAANPAAGIPINRNPSIDSIRIYSVEKNPLTYFDPSENKYPYTYTTITTDTTVIHVDTKRSYFIAVFTGNVDTTLSIDAALGNGTPLPEQHLTQWYMEFEQAELDKVAPADLMQITGGDVASGMHISQLFPSLDHAITHCIVWLEVDDQFLNELFRPHGSTLKEMVFRFEYGEE